MTWLGISNKSRFVQLFKKKVATSDCKGIRQSQLENKPTEVVRHDSMFVDLLETIHHDVIVFEKEYNEKLISTLIVDIMKNMVVYDCLTVISAQIYYRYISVTDMTLRH